MTVEELKAEMVKVEELDEDWHKMSRDELLENIANLIHSNRLIIIENWKEKKQIRVENLEMRQILEHGTTVLENAMNEVKHYEKLFKQGIKTILMWRTTSYLLSIILIWEVMLKNL